MMNTHPVKANKTQAHKVAVVSGSRADYGLLRCVLQRLRDDKDIELLLFVTGTHLSTAFGNSVTAIRDDGFVIHEELDILTPGNDAIAVCKSIGRAVAGFAELYARHAPDMVLVLGDRYEIFAAAQSALISRIPIAHIAGGDVTAGAFDDSLRHCISKMAALHFATNATAAKRLQQLGENPAAIHLVGSPGIDALLATPLFNRAELSTALEFQLRPHNFLVTLHPETLGGISVSQQVETVLAALDDLAELRQDIGLIFTGANADTGGALMNSRLMQFVATREHTCFHLNLGQKRYYSCLNVVDAVVGNSSSGLYEAPSFQKPVVNIGNRQKGREQTAATLNCEFDQAAIFQALQKALAWQTAWQTTLRTTGHTTDIQNPYGDGHSSERIHTVIKHFLDARIQPSTLQKTFYDYPESR